MLMSVVELLPDLEHRGPRRREPLMSIDIASLPVTLHRSAERQLFLGGYGERPGSVFFETTGAKKVIEEGKGPCASSALIRPDLYNEFGRTASQTCYLATRTCSSLFETGLASELLPFASWLPLPPDAPFWSKDYHNASVANLAPAASERSFAQAICG
jgi:hypothetical protein